MDDRLAKWLSTYQHPTQQKRPERTVMIKHPVTKNSAKEEPQNNIKKNIFHTFKNIVY